MLLNSMQGILGSQHEEESSLLRRKIEELNKNTVLLIVEAGKLIEASKQLSDQLKSFEKPQHEAEDGYHPVGVVPMRDYYRWLSIVAKSR
jgi:hypothetical protein